MITSLFMTHISPFAVPIIMIVFSLIAGAFCVIYGVKLIKRQIKLNNSIILVELKSTKIFYWLFLFIVNFFIVFTVFQMIDEKGMEVTLLTAEFNMQRWQANLTMSFLIVFLVAVDFLFITLSLAKSAVVDGGVYTSLKFLEWYSVHDYIIDEEKGIVILSSSKKTFSTLKGTTPPLKVAKNDIAKLKFILNKNKNKFSGFKSDMKGMSKRRDITTGSGKGAAK